MKPAAILRCGAVLALLGMTAVPSVSAQQQPATTPAKDGSSAPAAVNWDPPSKRDLVERALSDGMTDPAKIVEWAKNYKVTMTVDDVLRLKAELGK